MREIDQEALGILSAEKQEWSALSVADLQEIKREYRLKAPKDHPIVRRREYENLGMQIAVYTCELILSLVVVLGILGLIACELFIFFEHLDPWAQLCPVLCIVVAGSVMIFLGGSLLRVDIEMLHNAMSVRRYMSNAAVARACEIELQSRGNGGVQ